ncbi:MAG: phenylalanine--tRNA ligase subunit alpha [Deltaproteobacteria bacterium]|nr:phenylalanine--tRNA ligase subunit alpha [Deltaproteobacteria bacterium]
MIDLKTVEEKFGQEILEVKSLQELLQLKARFLGKKGELSDVLHSLRSLPEESRPVVGAEANRLKVRIEEECRSILERFKREGQEAKARRETIDVTLPGTDLHRGALHPISQVLEEVEAIFQTMGFEVHEGPEIESDYYNFEALNIPKNHPARDMQDTFYVNSAGRGEQLLLRTHTSPVQIRVMKKQKPPIRMIAPGVVYRRDSDMTHTPMFHQVEGLVVDEGIRFSDLKGVVVKFLDLFFGEGTEIRFRPSYFPFTEPSAEVDIAWKKGDWLEVIGCGMVHPNLFNNVGYSSKKLTGFAFGMGIERLAMLKYRIPDIRMFFENDLRFLEQFG